VISLDDYESLAVSGKRRGRWRSQRPRKGHLEELGALASSLLRGSPWPIPLEEQLRAMRISFAVEEHLGSQSCGRGGN
jgi:hypothetical protein